MESLLLLKGEEVSEERQVVMDRMDEQIETLILMHERAEWPGVAI